MLALPFVPQKVTNNGRLLKVDEMKNIEYTTKEGENYKGGGGERMKNR